MKNVRKSKKSLNYDVTPASDPTLTTVKEFERGRKRKRNEEAEEKKKKKEDEKLGTIL